MPIIDMPVEKLEKYYGTNPKPADHEEYWEKALAEMRAVDPCVQMYPAKFRAPTVECYDMYFTGVNGARIHVRHLRPKVINGRIPALLQFHGYSGCCGSWSGDKLAYAASGCAVFAMDTRGQGGESEDVGGVLGNTQNACFLNVSYESGWFKRFWQAFGKNFCQATVLWLILLAAAAVFVLDFLLLNAVEIPGSGFLKGITAVIAAVLLLAYSFVFPLQAHFDNSLFRTIRNAVILGISQFFWGLLMVLNLAFPFLLFFLSPNLFVLILPFLLLLGESLAHSLNAQIARRIFKKFQSPEELEADDQYA